MASDAELQIATGALMRTCGNVAAYCILLTQNPGNQALTLLLKQSLLEVIDAVHRHESIEQGLSPAIISKVVGRA